MPKRKQTDGDSTVSPDPGEIKALIGRVKQSDLAERDAQRIGRLLRLVLTLVSMREHKDASIARLKRLLFGPRSGKRGRRDALSPPDAGDATAHKLARIYYGLEKQGREYEERRGGGSVRAARAGAGAGERAEAGQGAGLRTGGTGGLSD